MEVGLFNLRNSAGQGLTYLGVRYFGGFFGAGTGFLLALDVGLHCIGKVPPPEININVSPSQQYILSSVISVGLFIVIHSSI